MVLLKVQLGYISRAHIIDDSISVRQLLNIKLVLNSNDNLCSTYE